MVNIFWMIMMNDDHYNYDDQNHHDNQDHGDDRNYRHNYKDLINLNFCSINLLLLFISSEKELLPL